MTRRLLGQIDLFYAFPALLCVSKQWVKVVRWASRQLLTFGTHCSIVSRGFYVQSVHIVALLVEGCNGSSNNAAIS